MDTDAAFQSPTATCVSPVRAYRRGTGPTGTPSSGIASALRVDIGAVERAARSIRSTPMMSPITVHSSSKSGNHQFMEVGDGVCLAAALERVANEQSTAPAAASASHLSAEGAALALASVDPTAVNEGSSEANGGDQASIPGSASGSRVSKHSKSTAATAHDVWEHAEECLVFVPGRSGVILAKAFALLLRSKSLARYVRGCLVVWCAFWGL